MDETLVEEIVLRYRAIVPMTTLGDHLLFMKVLHAHMTHPLQLDALLIATDEDLVHDVEGITQHFDTNAAFIASCFGRATLRIAGANATIQATSRSRPTPPARGPQLSLNGEDHAKS